MRNKEILDFLKDNIFKVINREDLLKDDLAGTMSRTTKRFANMIMADGIIRALLFAYSKAKYGTVRKIVEAQKNHNKLRFIEGNKAKSNMIWAMLIWLTIKILEKGGFLKVDGGAINTDESGTYNPLEILEIIERNASRIMIEYLIRHLDMLARIFDSYSK